MIGPSPILEIHESQVDGCRRLSLTGELDLASAQVLEERLARLRALKQPVTLNLSKLGFIDSTGLHLLIREIGEARANHWTLQLEPNLSPQVMRVFKLVHIEDLVLGGEAELSGEARYSVTGTSAQTR